MNHFTQSIRFLFYFAGILLALHSSLCPAALADAPGPSLTKEEISRLFHEANQLFAEGNRLALSDPEKAEDRYRGSILRFERIIKDGGIENGKLYYNIGNIYFRLKDIGRAIVNYRRAEQYIPGDINLQTNLEFARNIRKDRIAEKQETKILKTVFFWHYDLSLKTRIILFTFFFALLWVFAGVRIFIKKPALVWLTGMCAGLSVLFCCSAAVDVIGFHRAIPGVILSEEVIARKGNSASYEKSFKEPLHAGTEFVLLENRGSWLRVELPDARTCWVPSSEVELVREGL